MTRTADGVHRADPDHLAAALAAVTVWALDLAPDARCAPIGELDLRGIASAVAARMGGPLRMGWSAASMGVASRLWSATVVPYAAAGVLLDPAVLLARHDEGTVVLGVAEPAGWTDATVADLDRVIRSAMEPLIATIPLADRLLWGNAAASLHAVPLVHALPAARPIVEELLDGPGYRGEIDRAQAGRRRTCCLFYLAPGAGLCGDCVFDAMPVPTPRRDGRRAGHHADRRELR